MGLEDRDQPPRLQRPRRRDRRRDLGRVVGVVVDDERAARGLPQPLEPPAGAREARQRGDRRGQVRRARHADRLQRRGGVAGVVRARDLQHDLRGRAR